ncbi:hypothetical protein T09_9517 [Trichinella sp. T9]|nr:hypothetical protein T09_9517 [Trichinella sp. T9]
MNSLDINDMMVFRKYQTYPQLPIRHSGVNKYWQASAPLFAVFLQKWLECIFLTPIRLLPYGTFIRSVPSCVFFEVLREKENKYGETKL